MGLMKELKKAREKIKNNLVNKHERADDCIKKFGPMCNAQTMERVHEARHGIPRADFGENYKAYCFQELFKQGITPCPEAFIYGEQEPNTDGGIDPLYDTPTEL